MCVCTYACKHLPSNQSFYKQISSHQKGGDVSRWGEWVRKATAYKFNTCTLIGVHLTMHLVDPIKVHVSYMCLCMRVYMCECLCACVHAHGRVCVCVHVCVLVSSCQATKVLISKYLATRRVVVSVGGVNGSERQLLTSLIHAPYINWGPLDHASR